MQDMPLAPKELIPRMLVCVVGWGPVTIHDGSIRMLLIGEEEDFYIEEWQGHATIEAFSSSGAIKEEYYVEKDSDVYNFIQKLKGK